MTATELQNIAVRLTKQATLKQLASKVRIQCEYYGAKLDYDEQGEWQQQSNGWRCTLRYQGRQYSFDFWRGSAITGEPTVTGTLDWLLSEAQAGEQTFAEFCGEFGYDQDSRSAKQTWRACQKTGPAMRRLLGDDYEAFLYAERDQSGCRPANNNK